MGRGIRVNRSSRELVLAKIMHRFFSRRGVGAKRDRQDCKDSRMWEAPKGASHILEGLCHIPEAPPSWSGHPLAGRAGGEVGLWEKWTVLPSEFFPFEKIQVGVL